MEPNIWRCWVVSGELAKMTFPVVAAVLAGGKSTRMGQDKASLYSPKWQMTLLEQSLQRLNQLKTCRVVVSSNHYAGGIHDRISACGPLSGMHAVVAEHADLEVEGYLFVPVDMPQLTVDLLQTLLDFAREHQVACSPQHTVLPCYIPAAPDLLECITTQLQGTDWSVHRLLKHLKAKTMSWQDVTQLVNVNRPTDWQQYCV